jgi:hypothetical protein
MRYLTTTYKNFGVITEVDNLQGRHEVIGEKDVISFIKERRPHLVSFDGQRAFTDRPKELSEYAYNNKNYRFIFIPV